MVVQRRTDFLTRLSLDDTPGPNSKTRKLGMPQLLFLTAWPGFLEDTMLGILGGWGEDERVECCLFNRFHSEHGMLGLDAIAVDRRVVKELKEAHFAESGSHLSHMTTTARPPFPAPLLPTSALPSLLCYKEGTLTCLALGMSFPKQSTTLNQEGRAEPRPGRRRLQGSSSLAYLRGWRDWGA